MMYDVNQQRYGFFSNIPCPLTPLKGFHLFPCLPLPSGKGEKKKAAETVSFLWVLVRRDDALSHIIDDINYYYDKVKYYTIEELKSKLTKIVESEMEGMR